MVLEVGPVQRIFLPFIGLKKRSIGEGRHGVRASIKLISGLLPAL